jgi:hypothetical protein
MVANFPLRSVRFQLGCPVIKGIDIVQIPREKWGLIGGIKRDLIPAGEASGLREAIAQLLAGGFRAAINGPSNCGLPQLEGRAFVTQPLERTSDNRRNGIGGSQARYTYQGGSESGMLLTPLGEGAKMAPSDRSGWLLSGQSHADSARNGMPCGRTACFATVGRFAEVADRGKPLRRARGQAE